MRNGADRIEPEDHDGKTEGTRITVESILEKLGAGESVDTIVAEHPHLTRKAVLAAVEFGAKALRADVVYPIVGAAA